MSDPRAASDDPMTALYASRANSLHPMESLENSLFLLSLKSLPALSRQNVNILMISHDH